MAENPDLGQHCAMASCNRLDFLPFRCEHCSASYCRDHRLPDSHGCTVHHKLEQFNGDKPENEEKEEERKFLCSMAGCFQRERSRIHCQRCQQVFCMRHRICEDHACAGLERHEAPEKPKIELPTVKNAVTSNKQTNGKEKKLSAEQQARADRAQILKLKARNPLNLPADQQLFLYANLESTERAESSRHLVVVSRQWSVLKAIWHIGQQLGLAHSENLQAFSMATDEKPAQPIAMDQFVGEICPNESEIVLKAKPGDV